MFRRFILFLIRLLQRLIGVKPQTVGRARFPLSPEAAEAIAKPFQFSREWFCACGARLRIRSREDHPEGSSNFQPYPPDYKKPELRGHSILDPGQLTWLGMAEERLWKATPEGNLICPACQRGLPLAAYKAVRREELAKEAEAKAERRAKILAQRKRKTNG